jgi:hypothetical protein
MNKTLLILIAFLSFNSFSQEKENLDYPFTEFKFGDAPEKYSSNCTDITNPEALDEISLLMLDKVSIFGKISKKTKLHFYNNRLFRIEMEFDYGNWDDFESKLNTMYGQVWALDTTKEDKSGMWGPAKQYISMFELSGYASSTNLTFYDEYQKDFQFADLYQSSMFYVFAIILASLILYFIIAYYINAYCSKCKKFKMKYQGVSQSNPKDYDPGLLSSSNTVYTDMTYTYKCSNCKHVRKDHYKGFWKWFNSRNK